MPKLLITLFFFTLSSSPVMAAPIGVNDWSGVCTNTTTTNTGAYKIATLQGIECVFYNLLQLIIPFIGLASFIVLIFGGFQYLTSGGDPKQAQKAQSIITGAIIGIIVTIGIWFIFLLLETLTGLDLLQFGIPN